MRFKQPIFTDDLSAVIEIDGSPVDIELELLYDNEGIPSKVNVIRFEDTSKPLTIECPRSDYVKWGGYPDFKQSEVIPVSYDGREYKYLCTVYNNWGDMGTCNIFVLFKQDYNGVTMQVEDIYLEASCS
mgnify:CR=1 FL=1